MFTEIMRRPLKAMAQPPVSGSPPSENGKSDLGLQGRRILVVEDESLIALLIVDALEDAGALVVGPCFTLSECLGAAKSAEIDAAVLDVDLAGRDVFPAAEELKKRGIPFVFHTAHADREELMVRFGEVRVCRKPVDMGDLVTILARISGDPTN